MVDMSSANINVRLLQFLNDTELWHQVIHGSADVQIKTDGGPVSSVARVIELANNAAKTIANAATTAMIDAAKLEMAAKMAGIEKIFEDRVTEYLGTVGSRIDQVANSALEPHLASLKEMTDLAKTMTRKTVTANLTLPTALTPSVSASLIPVLATKQFMGVSLAITAPADTLYDFELFDGNPDTGGTVVFHARLVSGNYVDRLPFYAQVPSAVLYARLTNQMQQQDAKAFTASVNLSYLLG